MFGSTASAQKTLVVPPGTATTSGSRVPTVSYSVTGIERLSLTYGRLPKGTVFDLSHFAKCFSGLFQGKVLMGDRIYTFSPPSFIGYGSFSQVYSLKVGSESSDVVIKIFPKNIQAPAEKEEIEREARVLNLLGLAPAPLMKEDLCNYYLLMKKIEGIDLCVYFNTLLMKTGSAELPVRNFFQLVASLLEAVANCHDKGVIHRDIKIENVIINPRINPEIYKTTLIDYGFSIMANADGKPQKTLRASGTDDYIAPEACAESLFSYQSDIYALGHLIQKIIPYSCGRAYICFAPYVGLMKHQDQEKRGTIHDWRALHALITFALATTADTQSLKAQVEKTLYQYFSESDESFRLSPDFTLNFFEQLEDFAKARKKEYLKKEIKILKEELQRFKPMLLTRILPIIESQCIKKLDSLSKEKMNYFAELSVCVLCYTESLSSKETAFGFVQQILAKCKEDISDKIRGLISAFISSGNLSDDDGYQRLARKASRLLAFFEELIDDGVDFRGDESDSGDEEADDECVGWYCRSGLP